MLRLDVRGNELNIAGADVGFLLEAGQHDPVQGEAHQHHHDQRAHIDHHPWSDSAHLAHGFARPVNEAAACRRTQANPAITITVNAVRR